MGHREGFPAAGDAQQGLKRVSLLKPSGQLVNRLGLIPLRFELTDYLEITHYTDLT